MNQAAKVASDEVERNEKPRDQLKVGVETRNLVPRDRPVEGPLAGMTDSFPSQQTALATLLAGLLPLGVAALFASRRPIWPLRVVLGLGVVAGADVFAIPERREVAGCVDVLDDPGDVDRLTISDVGDDLPPTHEEVGLPRRTVGLGVVRDIHNERLSHAHPSRARQRVSAIVRSKFGSF